MLISCKTLIDLPSGQKSLSEEEAQHIIERVLNLQYKHTPTGVYVDRDCYKVSNTKPSFILAGSVNVAGTKHRVINYREIGSFKLYEYPNCYNLVIYNKKGREINKVISKDRNDLYEMIYAIRRLQ